MSQTYTLDSTGLSSTKGHGFLPLAAVITDAGKPLDSGPGHVLKVIHTRLCHRVRQLPAAL